MNSDVVATMRETLEDDDFTALDMLKWMVEAYHPQWYYTMEKTGYECSYCKCMFQTSKEFNDTSEHKAGCQWAQSKVWLEQFYRTSQE